MLPQRDLIGFRRDRREAVFIFVLNHYVISQRCSKPGLIPSFSAPPSQGIAAENSSQKRSNFAVSEQTLRRSGNPQVAE